MRTLALQRCLHHSDREAIARCPECGSFFCRECITEHEERIICAGCLGRLTAPRAAPQARRWPAALGRVIGALLGMFVAWVLFYSAGRALLAIPSDFHPSSAFSSRFSVGDE